MTETPFPARVPHSESILSQMQRDIAFRQVALDKAALVSITDTRGTIIHANPMFCEVSGYSHGELIGADHRLIKSDVHDRAFFRDMYRTIARGDIWKGEFCNRAKDGRLYWVDSTIVPYRSRSGKVTGYVSIRFDITRQKQAEATLWRHANIDRLTGLPNRAALLTGLTQSIAWAKAQSSGLAFALLDVDNFKEINDSFGHSLGDELLQAVGARLVDLVGPGNTVARLGGDEFALILPEQGNNQAFRLLIDAVLDGLRQPVPLAGVPSATTLSIGVVFFPGDGSDATQLIKNADIALYRAKAVGGDRMILFEPGMGREMERKMELRQRVSAGLRHDEFELFYQPIVSLATGAPNGLEALLRWRHPVEGLMAPGSYATVFEDQGLAAAVGRFVLDRALDQAATWTVMGVPFGKVAINVSASDFRNEAFVNRLIEQLEVHKLKPTAFCIEITENILLGHRADRIKHGLARLHSCGVEIALDDFGTGYASLIDLRNLPINRLKIDQAFVRGLCDKPRDRTIVTRLVQLAHDLGMRVTAEGVETDRQCDMLRTIGCDEVQGYLFSKPVAPGDVASQLSRLTPSP